MPLQVELGCVPEEAEELQWAEWEDEWSDNLELLATWALDAAFKEAFEAGFRVGRLACPSGARAASQQPGCAVSGRGALEARPGGCLSRACSGGRKTAARCWRTCRRTWQENGPTRGGAWRAACMRDGTAAGGRWWTGPARRCWSSWRATASGRPAAGRATASSPKSEGRAAVNDERVW
jgi:hypothetical protein